MKRISEYVFTWALGGTLYYTFEVFFRGFSHWTMFVLGGICAVFCVWQGLLLKWKEPLWIQIVRCTIFVVAGEFITGIVVNKWLGCRFGIIRISLFSCLGRFVFRLPLFFRGYVHWELSEADIFSIGFTGRKNQSFMFCKEGKLEKHFEICYD